MPDMTGTSERAFIMAPTTGIGDLAGGRVYKTQVPDHIELPREANGSVKPYAVASFSTPFASSDGRSVAGGEQSQPYILTFMVTSFAGNADDAEALDARVRLRLIGAIPSSTAGEITSSGGYVNSQKDSTSRPARYAQGSWFRVPINL